MPASLVKRCWLETLLGSRKVCYEVGKGSLLDRLMAIHSLVSVDGDASMAIRLSVSVLQRLLRCLRLAIQIRKRIMACKVNLALLGRSQAQLSALKARRKAINGIESEVVNVERILGPDHAASLESLQDRLLFRRQLLLKLIERLAVLLVVSIAIEAEVLELLDQGLLFLE